jgi:hypothetical protein
MMHILCKSEAPFAYPPGEEAWGPGIHGFGRELTVLDTANCVSYPLAPCQSGAFV